MRIGRTFLATTAALSVATWCMTAPAQTALLASPPDSAELREARVAIAHSPTQSTLWFSAKLEGAADDIHVIVPVSPGARVDLATDAWFEALADTTHTRVLPPQTPPDVTCEQARVPAPGDHDLVGDVGHIATVAPAAPAQVMTMSELVVWVQDQGMSLSFDALSQLADLDMQGFLFVRLRFEVDPGTFTLRTLRVASPSASAKVPLVLTSAGASPVVLRVWAFADGRANPAIQSWSTLNPNDVDWSLAGGVPPTTYREALGTMLDVTSWAVDASSHDAVYRSLPLGSGSSFLPAVVDGYFDRASGYGEALAAPASCIARVAAMESSMAKVGRVCAPGALVEASGPACEEDPQPGEIAADDLRCGGIADDLALAVAGISPGSLWLTRWTGKLSPWTERHEDSLAVHDGEPRSSVVVSGGWDSSVCDADAGTAGSTGSGGSGGGGTAPPYTGGYGGGSTWSPPQDPYEDPYGDGYSDDYGSDTQVYVEGSCWGDSSSSNRPYDEEEDDSCSGDSSSSSSSDESCSGDSSDTDDGETCAGDSSDSGESDACSGDSSDSGGEDACSGDSSSSSSSDACSGDSGSSGADTCSGSSSSSSDCSVTRRGARGRGRLPPSAFALLLVASALAARRLRKDEEARNPLLR